MTALIVILGVAVTVAALVTAAAWLDRHAGLRPGTSLALPARLVLPNTGHHRDRFTLTPVPEQRPGQAPRPGDPPWVGGAVRAGANLPALRGAARAGQAPGPGGYPVPPEEATTAPHGATWPGAGPGPDSPVPGPGRHPRQPWLYTVGYGPFERGPRAVIPAGRVSLRVTGGFPAIGDAPLVTRRYTAHEAYVDQPWRTL